MKARVQWLRKKQQYIDLERLCSFNIFILCDQQQHEEMMKDRAGT